MGENKNNKKFKANKMRKIIFGLAVVAMAATASAFTNRTLEVDAAAPIEAGILEKSSDANGEYYLVEPFGQSHSSCSPQANMECSFDWNDTTLPSKVYTDDPRITNLELNSRYQ